MRFNKNGIITSRNFKEYHIELDGSIWEQCLYHNNPSVNLFSSSDSFATGSVRVFVRVDVSKVKNYKGNDILMTNSIVEI